MRGAGTMVHCAAGPLPAPIAKFNGPSGQSVFPVLKAALCSCHEPPGLGGGPEIGSTRKRIASEFSSVSRNSGCPRCWAPVHISNPAPRKSAPVGALVAMYSFGCILQGVQSENSGSPGKSNVKDCSGVSLYANRSLIAGDDVKIKPKWATGERTKSNRKLSVLTTAEAIRLVKRNHVYASLRRIDNGESPPPNRQSRAYCLIESNHYSPMWVLKLASQEAGTPIGKSVGLDFDARRAKTALEKLGFTIERCPNAGKHTYPSAFPTDLSAGRTGAVVGPAPSRWDQAEVLDYLRTLDSLDVPRQLLARKEQAVLRRVLLGGRAEGTCAICGETYPVDLLVAAHIKKRCECNDSEKLERANVILMCEFGCDALFERGYITVSHGHVGWKPGLPITKIVERRVEELVGRQCAQWTKDNEVYFEWHHARTQRGW